jgi:hypothetical protein
VPYQELDDVVAVLKAGAIKRVARLLVEKVGAENDRCVERRETMKKIGKRVVNEMRWYPGCEGSSC